MASVLTTLGRIVLTRTSQRMILNNIQAEAGCRHGHYSVLLQTYILRASWSIISSGIPIERISKIVVAWFLQRLDLANTHGTRRTSMELLFGEEKMVPFQYRFLVISHGLVLDYASATRIHRALISLLLKRQLRMTMDHGLPLRGEIRVL